MAAFAVSTGVCSNPAEGETERGWEWEGCRGCVCGRGMPSSWLSTGDGDSCSCRGLIVLVDILSNNANKYTITHSSESERGKRKRGNGDAAQVCLVRTVTLCLGRVAAGRYPCLKDFHLFKCVLSKMDKRATLLWNLFQHSGAKVLKKCKEENSFVVPIIFFIYFISIF